MGIGRFFKSLVNLEVLGEEIIASVWYSYEKAEKMYPGAEPHTCLAHAWLARMTVRGRNPWNDQNRVKAFSETLLFACIPPPKNARALGLYFIYQERPNILQAYPKFTIEYDSLIEPLIEKESIDELYKYYNPKMASAQ